MSLYWEAVCLCIFGLYVHNVRTSPVIFVLIKVKKNVLAMAKSTNWFADFMNGHG